MNKYIITLVIFITIFLSLGITFTVLKLNNDEYINTKRQSEPNYTNSNSQIYLGLTITFFILFALLSIVLFFILNKKTNTPINSPIFKKLMSYDTTPDVTPDSTNSNSTPYGISSNSRYMSEDRSRNFPEFPNLM